MAQSIIIPEQKKSGMMGKGGAALGLMATGTPQGAMAGYSAGNAIESSTAKAAPSVVENSGGSAMSRRVESKNNIKQLQDAQAALAQLPHEEQKQYGPAINQAYAIASKQRGV